MAKRKRLNPFEIGSTAPVSQTGGTSLAAVSKSAAPPIARVAGESAGGGERALAMADEAGRLIHAVPIASINMFHLTRDRIKASDEGMEALRASILEHGQRMPVELLPTEEEPPYHFGLISGYRRMRALMDLARDHPGDARFKTVKAFIRQPDDLRGAYVAMVEENEIREDISHFERARVALMAARARVFDSVEAAVDVLYAAGSKARRSKIRSFVAVVEELGNSLVFPQAVNERLGLRLAEAIRAGHAKRLITALDTGSYEDPAGQNAALDGVLKDRIIKPKPAKREVSHAKPACPALAKHSLRGGGALTLHQDPSGLTLHAAGAEPDPQRYDEILRAVAAILDSGSDA